MWITDGRAKPLMDRLVVEVSSLSLLIHLSISSVYLTMCLSISPSTYLSIYLSVCLSIYLSICKLENEAILQDVLRFWTWKHQKRNNSAKLSQCLNLTTSKTNQFCETSSFFKVDNIKNEAILRDLLNFWVWQRQKRNNSARILHFSNLTTSKTKESCETSSVFEVNNVKNETILRDFLQKWKVKCSADGLVPMRFAIFPLHLSKVLRLPRKIDARSYEVLHLSRKIILANLQIWCSKMQPLWGNQRPDILTSLMNMSFVLRPPREMHLCRSSSNVPRLPSFLEMLRNPHVLLTSEKVHNPLRLPRETHLKVQKWSEPPVYWTCFNMLTSKCASRHNGVHFFDISTSKSGPDLVCFVHFDFKMCFAPQRRALFRHRNFQKWSGAGALCAFWLRNVLRAATACTFSTSQLVKMIRSWCALHILTWKCASRHNGVQFFISHLASWLRTRRFSEPTFRPSGATKHWKNRVFRDFPTFSRICIFFLLTLSRLWSSLFYSSLLSDSSHLCLSSVHIAGSLTSKLPSISVLISLQVNSLHDSSICWTCPYSFSMLW